MRGPSHALSCCRFGSPAPVIEALGERPSGNRGPAWHAVRVGLAGARAGIERGLDAVHAGRWRVHALGSRALGSLNLCALASFFEARWDFPVTPEFPHDRLRSQMPTGSRGSDLVYTMTGTNRMPHGVYKVWCQARREGRVLTFPFVITL